MINFLEKNKPLALFFVILMVIEIYFFSSIPGTTPMGPGWAIIPTAYHFIAFFLLTFFILIYVTGKKKINLSLMIFSITITIAFALLDEFHQMFVPMRFSSMNDILIDVAGAFLSTSFYSYINYKKPKYD